MDFLGDFGLIALRFIEKKFQIALTTFGLFR